VTEAYGADRAKVVEMLNTALATELLCVLRYKRHYFTAEGLDAEQAAAEFLEHANQEQMHADQLAERIVQLGGEPEMDPAKIADRSHAEYDGHMELDKMIEADFVAERIAVDSYREMIAWIGDSDPTTRRMLEEILATEEEHADDLAGLLEKNAG